jgi:hypothetical protein
MAKMILMLIILISKKEIKAIKKIFLKIKGKLFQT